VFKPHRNQDLVCGMPMTPHHPATDAGDRPECSACFPWQARDHDKPSRNIIISCESISTEVLPEPDRRSCSGVILPPPFLPSSYAYTYICKHMGTHHPDSSSSTSPSAPPVHHRLHSLCKGTPTSCALLNLHNTPLYTAAASCCASAFDLTSSTSLSVSAGIRLTLAP
jgi:hypothetical protein